MVPPDSLVPASSSPRSSSSRAATATTSGAASTWIVARRRTRGMLRRVHPTREPRRRRMAKLTAGDRAPAFTLLDQSGKKVKLTDFKGKRVVLYFYPKADTPGCTTQSCELRDHR